MKREREEAASLVLVAVVTVWTLLFIVSCGLNQ